MKSQLFFEAHKKRRTRQLMTCLFCKNTFFEIPSRIKTGRGKFCSKKCFYSSPKTQEARQKISESLIGLKAEKARHWKGGITKGSKFKNNKCKECDAIIKNSSIYCLKCVHKGERCHFWQDGKMQFYPQLEQIRKSPEYDQWRTNTFIRDDYECQICGSKKSWKLQANHIKRFIDYPELRLEPLNGITLCKSCHVKLVTNHEKEWESYFNFNLEVRGYL